MTLYFSFFILNIEATIHMFHFAECIFAGIHWFPIISVWNENKLAGQLCNIKRAFIFVTINLHYCYRGNVKSSETLPCNNNETDQK